MHPYKLRALAALCSAFLFSTALFAANGHEVRRGVIADPERELVFIGLPVSGVEAVDSSSGRSVWKSDAGALPLASDDRTVLVRGEEKPAGPRLPIALLDVATGQKSAEAVVTLPEGVRALVTAQKGRTFTTTAVAEANGFLVTWTYFETVIQGVTPLEGEMPPVRTVSGAFRVNAAGKVIELPEPPSLPDRANEPWRAGNVLASIEGGRGEAMTLKRREAGSGAPLPDVVLSRRALLGLPSADRRHIVVSERAGEGSTTDPEYRWAIVSLENGTRIGELRRNVSAAPFFLTRDNVVYESRPHGYKSGESWIVRPLELEAVRLSGGIPVWNREIRDLDYRGVLPPQR